VPESNAGSSPRVAAPLKVLVVDDSAIVRQVLSAVLTEKNGFQVTVAADPLIAMDKMKKSRPDVILLDLEMPRMDGMTFLRKLMADKDGEVLRDEIKDELGLFHASQLRLVDIVKRPEGDVIVATAPAFSFAW
jgi:two-component system chemotaxis response regulator CheB